MLTKEEKDVIEALKIAVDPDAETIELRHLPAVCEALRNLRDAPPSKVVEITYIPPRGEGRNVMIPCVKVVRYYGGLGLTQAYELCKSVQAGSPRAVYLIRGDAQSMIAELEEIGAKAEAVKETP